MVLTTDQQRIKDLLSETIILLCRNGLNFKTEFSIEALIGITLDQDDVFLISIKETVETSKTVMSLTNISESININITNIPSPNKSGDGKNTPSINDSTPPDQNNFSSDSGKQNSSESVRRNKRHRKSRSRKVDVSSFNNSDAFNFKRMRWNDVDEGDLSSADENLNDTFADKVDEDLCMTDENVDNHRSNVDACKNSSYSVELNLTDIVLDDMEAGSTVKADLEDANYNSMSVKEEPLDDNYMDICSKINTRLYSGWSIEMDRKLSGKSASFGIMHPLLHQQHGGQQQQQQQQQQQSLVKFDVASHIPRRRSIFGSASHQRVKLEHNDFKNRSMVHPSSVECDKQSGPPRLSPIQVMMAVEILSISGSFVNIGSAKAFQHNLRRLSKSELSEILNRMSVPAANPHCIGLLCTEGVSRIFYKIPPPLIKNEALTFYNLNLYVYSNLYYGTPRVPHNVKEPEEWRCMLERKSPFFHMLQSVSGDR